MQSSMAIRRHFPLPTTWQLEAWSGVTLLVWAMWSLHAHAEGGAEWAWNYRYLYEARSPLFWACVASVLGVAQLVVALKYRERRWIRWGTAFMVSALWVMVTISLWCANSTSAPGLALYIMQGVTNGAVCGFLVTRLSFFP